MPYAFPHPSLHQLGTPTDSHQSAAPAVEDKPAVVTGKTKSGRVTKSKAPAAKKTGTAKKPAAKKASAPKKVSAKKEAPAAAAA